MPRILTATLLFTFAVTATAAAEDARAVIDLAAKTMGAAGLDSITYSGLAALGNFGQSRTISFGLASTTIRNYTRTIDFVHSTSRTTGVVPGPVVQGGPPAGEYEQVTTADTPWPEQFEIWVTPWGFLRGAAERNATLKSQKLEGVPYKVITWSPSQKAPSGAAYRIVGYINSDNLVERVETWVEHPIFGDMHVETMYSQYRDVGGLKVPGRIAQRRVGMETFVALISSALGNPANLSLLLNPSEGYRPPLAPVATTTPAPSEEIAKGVYLILGDYKALAVELKDAVVVLGGGDNEARGQAIIAETRRRFPAKPIKYVVCLHPHFDHAAVLPPFAAEGITILADDTSRYFVEQALSSPRTLVGDALAKSRKKPKVEGVFEKMVLGDAARSIELYHLEKFEHSDAMLIAFLPQEKILFTSDIALTTPGVRENLERLQLTFDRHVTVR